MTDTRQDTPEAIERLADVVFRRGVLPRGFCLEPNWRDVEAALRAYAQLLRQVAQVRVYGKMWDGSDEKTQHVIAMLNSENEAEPKE